MTKDPGRISCPISDMNHPRLDVHCDCAGPLAGGVGRAPQAAPGRCLGHRADDPGAGRTGQHQEHDGAAVRGRPDHDRQGNLAVSIQPLDDLIDHGHEQFLIGAGRHVPFGPGMRRPARDDGEAVHEPADGLGDAFFPGRPPGLDTQVSRVPVLEIIVEQLADIETKPGDIQVSCSPGLAIIADRAEFSMMLANYLDNALAYGGPPVDIQAAESEGYAEIRVADHGPGVPAPFVPRLFERFTRAPATEHKAEGTGLGLWIVRTFAHANGGNAWYEPGATGGSCFCLRLPLA